MSSVTFEEFTEWNDSGEIPQDRLSEAHFCPNLDWALLMESFENCVFCQGHDLGPQKSPSSGAAVRAQQRQLAAELEESE